MSEKLSRGIFIVELIIFVLPVAAVLLAATVLQVIATVEFFEWYNIFDAVLIAIADAATFSGLYISRVFLRHGSAGLQNIRPVWWILSLLGVILFLAAAISKLLPPAPAYSVEEMLRYDLELSLLGLPLMIPLIHLLLERFVRRSEDVSVASAQRNLP